MCVASLLLIPSDRKLKIKRHVYASCEERFLGGGGGAAIPSSSDSQRMQGDHSHSHSHSGDGGGGVFVPLTTIDLLSMREMDAAGYYRSLASIHLHGRPTATATATATQAGD